MREGAGAWAVCSWLAVQWVAARAPRRRGGCQAKQIGSCCLHRLAASAQQAACEGPETSLAQVRGRGGMAWRWSWCSRDVMLVRDVTLLQPSDTDLDHVGVRSRVWQNRALCQALRLKGLPQQPAPPGRLEKPKLISHRQHKDSPTTASCLTKARPCYHSQEDDAAYARSAGMQTSWH